MSNDSAGRDGRHTARKNEARELRDRTGMPYAAALRQVTRAATPWEPRHRWILDDDLRAWIDGKTWRGVSYGDLRAWIDDEVSPDYECRWCDEPGDARREDSVIELLVSAYDPDLQPETRHLDTHKYHARCKPLKDESEIFGRPGAGPLPQVAWLRRADIPSGPQRIGLPAITRPDIEGEFDLEARALLAPARDGEPETAVLLVTAQVTDDRGQGAAPWLSQLQLQLNSEGLGHPDSLAGTGCGWSLRVVTGYSSGAPDWIAIRLDSTPEEDRRHLLLCAVDMPDGWADAARRDGKAVIAIGPCTAHWDDIPVTYGIPGEVAEDIEDDLDPGACGCDAIAGWHAEELVGGGAFVGAVIRVVPEDG